MIIEIIFKYMSGDPSPLGKALIVIFIVGFCFVLNLHDDGSDDYLKD